MKSFIDQAVQHARPVLLILVFLLIAGGATYIGIPKEAEPDVAIPIIYVSMHHEGISPEDAERLLIRPMENELRSIEGVKELRATASEGHASVTLEFEAGFDSDAALADVREKVDIAKAELPEETDEPLVNEVNVALFPVLVVALFGEVPESVLLVTARKLRDKLESLPGVLEVDIAGNRDDLLEVLVDPVRLESYNITQEEIFSLVQRNNELVAAGALDTGQGRFSIKVPGLFETASDLLNLPVKVVGDTVVTFSDVATGRRTYKDPTGFARVNGKPAVTLEVSKRLGTNIIEVIEQVKATVEEEKSTWSSGLQVSYSQDKSQQIRSMLKDLQNNVMAAVLLVMIVMVAVLGLRPAGMVGISIPGSFLTGILVISLLGLTMNMVVLFALIMAVGMLVDGTIVVVELADRKMAEGLRPREAYAVASKRMAMPIIAATATTLAAFLPLLFWPGIVGEFMKYLPITLIATLSASLVMALIFVPTLGAIAGRRAYSSPAQLRNLTAAESGSLEDIGGPTRLYLNFLRAALRAPGAVVVFALLGLIAAYVFYANHGRGVEFFPQVEPERAILNVSTRGDLSIYERDALVQEVEARIAGMTEFKTVYARSSTETRDEIGEDVIGSIQIEFVDWRERRAGRNILDEVRARTADLAGLIIEVREEERGPSQGKGVQIQLSSRFPDLLPEAIARLRAKMESMPGLVDVTDSRPVPGIEWQVQVDRAEASRYGADIITVGNAVQLVTNGIKVGEYRPHDADEEVDIRVRYPTGDRSTGELDRLRVPSAEGAVPISNFVQRVALPRVGTIKRSDTRRALTVEADAAENVLTNDMVNELRAWLTENPPHDSIEVAFKGEDEDQRDAQAFLIKAFVVALFVMAVILVTQFNSFYQAFLILSAVVFSTIGVLMGLLIIDEPFGIVMSGVGVISLAGIVVNNNIVLIDTFNHLHLRGMSVYEAILRTGVLRLRPVLLTTTTTILGLMPMVLGMNIDLIGREIVSGGPSTQWWTQLATAVAGGLAFATLLTLVVTPAMLLLGTRQQAPSQTEIASGLEPAANR